MPPSPSLRRRLVAGAFALLLPGLAAAQPATTRVSVGSGGVEANDDSYGPTISDDGRMMVFSSDASNLVGGDTNGWTDVFVHDRQTGATTRVSVGPGGIQANSYSFGSAISADGRWVLMSSQASNLVADDTNGSPDVFVHDLQAQTTTRLSVATGGAQGNNDSSQPAMSADGRWVAFHSHASNLVDGDTNGASDVFVHDRQTGTTTRVSQGGGSVQGNDSSFNAAISADGRWVAFDSWASNLVAGDTNGTIDVFVHDRQEGTTTRVSVGSGGTQANDLSRDSVISADGRWVTFYSQASNLLAGDTNGKADAFVHDRETGATTRVSVRSGGAQGNGDSYPSAITAHGRWVVFYSEASNLVAGDTNGVSDAFVFDQQMGTTSRVSVGPGGIQGNHHSVGSGISADGRWVGFQSIATNLVSGDTNSVADVFVYDRVDPECGVTLATDSALAPAAGADSDVQVTAPAGCGWTAVSNDSAWLIVTGGSSGTGPGTANYSVAANPGAPRTGSLTIWGQMFVVHQASATTPETPTALVAASVAGNLVTLRWTIPPGGPAPTTFVLEGGLHPGEILASIPTGSAAPVFSFTAPSGSFYVRVHALSGAVRSAASNEIRIHVNAPVAPSAPANLVGLVNGSTLTLAWTNTYAGGAPTSLWLEVTGTINAWIPLGVTETFSFAGVPAGTYRLFLRAQREWRSSPSSNFVTLTFPGPCPGPPETPADVVAYRVGRTVFVTWAPAAFGPAPTGYVLHVTGSLAGGFASTGRALSGTVGPGSYTLSVVAVNPCGPSASSPSQTVVVP